MATTTLQLTQIAKRLKRVSDDSKEKSTNSDYIIQINTFEGFGVSDRKIETRSNYRFL